VDTRPAQPVGDGSATSILEEEDVSMFLWYISQRWLNLAQGCKLAYVVVVVSKSKEESDLADLAWESKAKVKATKTHDEVAGRLAEQ
jgi:hypothetical protein